MRLGDSSRICHVAVAILLALSFARPAQALWLDLKGELYPAAAPLVVNPDAVKPPPGDTKHGLSALPPTATTVGEPRLKMQYRADFPRSVTIETNGALVADNEAAAGALSLTTRIIFVDRWWSPKLNASLTDLDVEGMAQGDLQMGGCGLRSEWTVKF